MDNPNLQQLLVTHPPPWNLVTTGGWVRAVDAHGNVVEFQERCLPGLVEAVNVANDYLEVIADMLEEQEADLVFEGEGPAEAHSAGHAVALGS